MINTLWLVMIVIGVVTAAFNGRMADVSTAILQGAADTISILIQLLGPICFWLGLMKIARSSGLVNIISKLLRPVIRYIFPEIPSNHPANGAVILNMTANILGLGNSATPLGIKAMQELQDINDSKVTATPAMCTLLALNTSSITLIPATIISLRAATGSARPASVLITTLFATTFSTITALLLDRIFRLYHKGL